MIEVTSHVITRGRIPEQIVPGKRLGRHYLHDSRSLAYLVPELPQAALSAVLWTRNIPILDQGQVGSCTTNAGVGCLGTDPLYGALPPGSGADGKPLLDEPLAVNMYSEEEQDLDGSPFPPTDDGGDGTTTCKIMVRRKFSGGFLHCTSIASMQSALQKGPLMIGINWYDSMDSPSSSGLITISPGAQVRGGHELELRGVDPAAFLFKGDNSWSEGWGDHGSFEIAFATMDRLLSEQGDCTQPLPASAPKPTPTPVPPSPVPGDLDYGYGHDPELLDWARRNHIGENAYAAHAYTSWRASKGY